jgi:hypothetical protein
VAGALVARQATDWVLQGSESAKFIVTRNSKITTGPDSESLRTETKK